MDSTDLHAQFMPEPQGPDLDAFKISGTHAVRSLIQEIVRRNALITLYARRDHMFFVATQVLEFDDGTIDFDLNTDDQRRAAILAGDDCIVIAFLDQIKTQFDVKILEARLAGERWRLRCQAPNAVYRMQRRDAYRIALDRARECQCIIRGAEHQEVSRSILDLSVSGVSLEWPLDAELPVVGTVWEHARIEIGDRMPLPCTLQVRYLNPASDDASARIGCSFIFLPPEIERGLQMLVTDVQRARIRRG